MLAPRTKKPETSLGHKTSVQYVLESGSPVASHSPEADLASTTNRPSLDGSIHLPIRLIPIETVCEILGHKRSATLNMVAKGILPPPLKFGASRRASARWIEQEIVDFIMKKAAERNATTSPTSASEATKWQSLA